MRHQVIEQQVVAGKGTIENCEDTIVVTNNFVCVIDGVTSKSKRLWDGHTTGWMAAHILSETVTFLPAEITCYEAIERLASAITNYYHNNNVFEEMRDNLVQRFSATLVLYSAYHSEVWMVGDCQCMMDGILHEHLKLVDQIMSDARALYLHTELRKGKSITDLMEHDTGRAFIQPFLDNQQLFQNYTGESPYAYGVIDGFATPQHTIKVVPVEEGTRSLVLASDGYPELKPTLAESEAALRFILDNDPLCIHLFKSTKGLVKGQASLDDRAYVRVELMK
jgi:hypothetical protein